MVSMGPNTLHYNFTNKWRKPCEANECSPLHSIHTPKTVNDNLYDMISKEPTLSKTTKIIQKGNLVNHFKNGSYTLFVTEDINIPDSFIDMLDYYNSRKFILSYTIKALGSIEQLLDSGNSVYESSQIGSPILSIVTDRQSIQAGIQENIHDIFTTSSLRRIQQPKPTITGTIVINKVGKVTHQIKSSTGNIIIMNNIANVLI